MIDTRVILRHLVFTGSHRVSAKLEFTDGLNLLYGASNTGKSFTLKAVDFMLGGSDDLPDFSEREGYETILLGFSILGVGEYTVARAMSGGLYRLHDGLVMIDDPIAKVQTLAATQKSKNQKSLSQFFLENLGFANRQLAKNKEGEKDNLSFRDLVIASLVDETSIQIDRSPIHSDLGPIGKTKERSLFRMLLTGRDDGAIIPVINEKKFASAKATRIEVVQELLDGVKTCLTAEFPARDVLREQFDLLSLNLVKEQANISNAQNSIHKFLLTKRQLATEISDLASRAESINVHLQRFAQLDAIYESDVERLQTLEEAGFLLSVEHLNACTLCGAPPEAQIHHEIEDISSLRQASLLEIEKIKLHRTELTLTIFELKNELSQIRIKLPECEYRLSSVESDINLAMPNLSEQKIRLGQISATQSHLQEGLFLIEQSELYEIRLKEYNGLKKPSKDDYPSLAPSALATHEFAQIVGRVLKAWEFPGALSIEFDDQNYDIKIDGKLRTNNGKGVRAVTHAAFKVALLIFCRERQLPHPGFVVLDTPLLTYRDPMINAKAGALSEDEKNLANTLLKQRFFEHLASIKSLGQFIVLENIDPPDGIAEIAAVQTFTGIDGGGRKGLFIAQ